MRADAAATSVLLAVRRCSEMVYMLNYVHVALRRRAEARTYIKRKQSRINSQMFAAPSQERECILSANERGYILQIKLIRNGYALEYVVTHERCIHVCVQV